MTAIVEWWSNEEGWGALAESDEMPGGAFVHFSAIQMDGYKALYAGQKVDATIEGPLPFDQDGYRYRATAIWPPSTDLGRYGRRIARVFTNVPRPLC